MDGFSLAWKRTAADSIIPVGPGAYVVPVKGASLTARAAALSRLLPDDVVIARRTAAWIWGLDVLPPGVDEADWDVELITLTPPAESPGRRPFADAESADSPALPSSPPGASVIRPDASSGFSAVSTSSGPSPSSSTGAVPVTSPGSSDGPRPSMSSSGLTTTSLALPRQGMLQSESPPSGRGRQSSASSEAVGVGDSSMKPREPPQISADTVDVPADHIVEKAGVRLTSPARTALDCARWLPRYEAVAALDQFLRRGVKPEELAKMARTLPGYRGNKRLREVIRLGDRGAASPGESWIRVAVVKTGFPRPDTQIPVMGRHGRWLYVDLGYPEFQVGLEYDGERYHSGRRARTHDERRRDWLAKEMGWEIIPVTKSFLHRPAPYLGALLTAMLQRGWTPDGAVMEHLAARLSRLRRRR